VITIILIHPTQPIPVNRWTFKDESILRIGRAKDNDVVIYNAVVSRHHIELWKSSSGWEIVNFGANGTFFAGQPLNQEPVSEGMVIRLGHSGPRLLIKLSGSESDNIHQSLNKNTLSIPQLDDTSTLEDETVADCTTRVEYFDTKKTGGA
jgi:pSer/pThr/pTyr-binding forkhead associated (FHA) protein